VKRSFLLALSCSRLVLVSNIQTSSGYASRSEVV
jgi:hypothetical protein